MQGCLSVAGRDGRQPGSPASHGRITDRATALDTAAPDGHAAGPELRIRTLMDQQDDPH